MYLSAVLAGPVDEAVLELITPATRRRRFVFVARRVANGTPLEPVLRPGGPDGAVNFVSPRGRCPIDGRDRPVGQLHRRQVIEAPAAIRATEFVCSRVSELFASQFEPLRRDQSLQFEGPNRRVPDDELAAGERLRTADAVKGGPLDVRRSSRTPFLVAVTASGGVAS